MATDFWSKIRDERMKLVFAYIIIPISIIYMDSSPFQGEAKQYAVIFSFVGLLFIVLPPTIFRFLLKKDGLNSGREITLYMTIFSAALSLLLYVFEAKTRIYSFRIPSFQELLIVYLILSYKCQCRNEDLPSIFFIALVLIIIASVKNIRVDNPNIVAYSMGRVAGAVVIVALLYLARYYKNQWTRRRTQPHNEPPHEPSHTEQHEDNTQASILKLVNLGLACIGRKTKHSNLYLTGMESKRQQAEYTFLRQVAEKYRDAGARKVIARHFMLYKECCLYVIYSVVLKHEPELHRLVRVELTERLTDGLTAEAKARRKEYMYAFSKAFYDEYQRTKSRHQTLSFTFWSVLCIKHPEILSAPELSELMSISGLASVYRYTQETLEAALQHKERQV